MSRGRLVGIVVPAATVIDELLDEDGGITPVAELFIRRVEWSDAGRGECEASEATRGQASRAQGTNACSAAARQGRQNRIARTYTAFDDAYPIHDREREAGGGGRESRKNRKTPANQRMENKSEKKGRARDGLDWPSRGARE
ncbi:hypothetical protein HETIRDRAFT_117773 [Heterobasidion irregulare TC 32-1]|uniref:Uncharacterized protein n=1 Tax=Heterobasidion irregulare (strain TC 32-1) TaxID=747525 RepID=W4K1I7_HETIT|nr:uncharacterized protein HETIRDRAFT_117773 [Heterobasidion irregulare TC 32-1]ETW79205.1 hypothetical protein HETIRDRAFT_117773 [Heterobasidion irregulare TC 32-1]